MATSPPLCAERQRLLKEFMIAVQEQNNLQTDQIKALIDGEGFNLEREIADARERRDQAKYAVMEHEESHGCS
jgi:hypothetical protein